MEQMIPGLIFGLLALLVIGLSLVVVMARSVFHSAIALTAALSVVAGLFALLGADFVAAGQLLLGLRQVEGQAVCLGEHRDEKHEERDQHRDPQGDALPGKTGRAGGFDGLPVSGEDHLPAEAFRPPGGDKPAVLHLPAHDGGKVQGPANHEDRDH